MTQPSTAVRGRAAVAALLLSAVLAGCDDQAGSGDPDDQPSSPAAAVTPTVPTSYMEDARRAWNRYRGDRPFQPYRDGDLRWVGDPRDYERVCGAEFLLPDDSIPAFYAAPDGAEDTGDGPTYYEWLQSDPERWGAFNAWLNDPAVLSNLAPQAENFGLGYGRRQGLTGDPSACPGAARQVAQPTG